MTFSYLDTWILELWDCSASGFFSCRVPSTDCGVYSRIAFNRTYTENSSLDRRIIQFSYQLFLYFNIFMELSYVCLLFFIRSSKIKDFRIFELRSLKSKTLKLFELRFNFLLIIGITSFKYYSK